MKQILLMERVLDQTRLAVIEEDQLCELYLDRPGDSDLSGNIYLGRVENVVPGLNAAFVDIGLDKKGFLSASDIRLFAQADAQLAAQLGKARIEKKVRPGQTTPVQVVKTQSGGKGPRLSGYITLPGRLMVLLTGVSYVGVSRKIEDKQERERLLDIGRLISTDGDGVILRTAARGATQDMIWEEYARLQAQWAAIKRRAEYAVTPALLHDDNDLTLRVARDMLTDDVETVWIDDTALRDRLAELASVLAPMQLDKLRLHEGQTPLFDLYRVDVQLDKALDKYVWLKGGGSLVIEETEALTVVDVNTGKNTGKRDVEETIFENNCEAAREAMRQLRLRELGGIIVVDFIDMRSAEHRQALMELLKSYAERDRSRTTVVDMTPLGLVELKRKKDHLSLSRRLMYTCSDCGGNGVVPAHETTARRALREVWRRRRSGDGTPLAIEANPGVCAAARAIAIPGSFGVRFKAVEDMTAGAYRLTPVSAT